MQDELLIIKPKRLKGEDGHKNFSVRMREDLVERLEKLSAQSGHSRNELISMLVEYALDHSVVDTSNPEK